LAAQRSSLSSLQSLEVVLTTTCNLCCAYCFQDVRADRSMGWPVLRSALDLLMDSDHPAPEVIFTGGEPLLELPLIMRAVDHLETTSAVGRRVGVTVFTNGVLFDRGTARYLARHRIDTQISCDGVEPAQELRAPGTFGRLDRALSTLHDEHPEFLRERCTAAVTLSSRNLAHLADSAAYLVERGVGTIVVSALATHDPGWHPEMIEELAGQMDAICQLSIEHARRTGDVPFAPFKPAEEGDLAASDPPEMCAAAGTSGLAVDVDGQVYGCVLFAESFQTIPDGMLRDCLAPMRLGDIRAPGLGTRLEQYPAAARAAGIFTDKQDKYSSYRRCEGCRYLCACSVCPVSIGHIPGNTDPHRVPDLQCAFNLAVLTAREHFLEATQEVIPAARS
jgi:sulfatase maturation enzyme AslB (radical SAM superfamily)